MNVSKANSKDLESICSISRETVRLVNSRDYMVREFAVWSANAMSEFITNVLQKAVV